MFSSSISYTKTKMFEYNPGNLLYKVFFQLIWKKLLFYLFSTILILIMALITGRSMPNGMMMPVWCETRRNFNGHST